MLGGNDKLNAHFAKYGVKGSIIERYNSPAAALFRDTIIAMRDGTPVPTDIAPYEAEMAAEMAAKAARASETPAERDARTRAETQERMRAKFGADGLKNQSLGSSGLSGGESSSARSGGGGGAGSGGASFDDFFGVDFSAQCVPWGARECGHASQGSSPPVRLCRTAALSSLAGSAVTKVTEVARVASVRVAEGSRELGRRVQEQHIGEKVAVSRRAAAAAPAARALLLHARRLYRRRRRL